MTSTPIPPTTPSLLSLAHVSPQPLQWLWPHRIPLGHLTLLDAAPDSGLSLFLLNLAASLSRGTLPDCPSIQPINILLIAPYETADDIILPRFAAAGGDLTRLTLYRPTIQETPQTTVRYRCLDFPRDLDQLLTTISQLDARLVIIDPASSVTGLKYCLPALVELTHHTRCAILLTRTLSHAPADPLHASIPASPLLNAAHSRLLLTPDPNDDHQHLLLTTKHSLCGPSSILSYDITLTDTGVPTLHWLAERDHTSLARLSTGPLHSLHRQAILRFLQNSSSPQPIKDILTATSYDYEAGRKMLVRMRMAGELSPPPAASTPPLTTPASPPSLLPTHLLHLPSPPHLPMSPLSHLPPRHPHLLPTPAVAYPMSHLSQSFLSPTRCKPPTILCTSHLSQMSQTLNI